MFKSQLVISDGKSFSIKYKYIIEFENVCIFLFN